MALVLALRRAEVGTGIVWEKETGIWHGSARPGASEARPALTDTPDLFLPAALAFHAPTLKPFINGSTLLAPEKLLISRQ